MSRSNELKHGSRLSGKHGAVKEARKFRRDTRRGKGYRDARKRYNKAARKEAKNQLRNYDK